jgi:predicted XRE-type DNA-binding protein
MRSFEVATDPIPALKEQLAHAILADVGYKSPLQSAGILGLDESRMSNLELGRLERFSLQKLIRLLAVMNRKVELSVVSVGPVPRLRYDRPHERPSEPGTSAESRQLPGLSRIKRDPPSAS